MTDSNATAPTQRDPEQEELGPLDSLPPTIVFDESKVSLDDEEASEMTEAVVLDEVVPSVLDDAADDEADRKSSLFLPDLYDDVVRAGSWLQAEAEAMDSVVELPSLDNGTEEPADDLEGPTDALFELGAAPPLVRGDDEGEGPLDGDALGIRGAPWAFSLAAPSEPSFVLVSERDADAMIAARTDTLRTADGGEGPSRASRENTTVASAQCGDTLAFAFARGPGRVSVDGGERFDEALWLDGATALAAVDGALFAAIYDAPVDRCTILRARGGLVERVADLHGLFGADAGTGDEEARFAVRALVALDASGTKLLARTLARSVVFSVR